MKRFIQILNDIFNKLFLFAPKILQLNFKLDYFNSQLQNKIHKLHKFCGIDVIIIFLKKNLGNCFKYLINYSQLAILNLSHLDFKRLPGSAGKN